MHTDAWIREFWRRSFLLREMGDGLPPALKASQWPNLETLNASLKLPCLNACKRLRLVPAQPGDKADLGYEQRILARGEIATRTHNWHDFFNALIWSRFPRLKQSLNAIHCAEIDQQHGRQRNRRRDALTLFDECGVIVLSDNSRLLDCLARHQWKGAFVDRRTCWEKHVQVLAFGHALCAQALAPYSGWTANALLLCQDGMDRLQPDRARCARVDRELAARVHQGAVLITPADLSPLPLLGIPGMRERNAERNATPTDYDDVAYFRPLPKNKAAAPVFNLG